MIFKTSKRLLPVLFILLGLGIFQTNAARADWAATPDGCKVQIDSKSKTDPDSLIFWSGKCKDGFADGAGTVMYNYTDPNEVGLCKGAMQRGKIVGHSQCVMKNGNTFVGTIENGEIIGEATYTWQPVDCPKCMRKYQGTYYNKQFAQGTLTLANGEEIQLKYYPTSEGCLIWNEDPKPDETITWSGACEGGLANGEGVLKYTSDGQIETTTGTMAKGMIEGQAVITGEFETKCKDCVVRFEGAFKHNTPVKGSITYGDGRTEDYLRQGSEQQELEKLLSEALIFDLAMMQMKQQMAMSAAMADLSNQVSCNMDPSCMMVKTYEWVPTYP